MSKFSPNWLSAPGVLVQHIANTKSLAVTELQVVLDLSKSDLQNLLNGELVIEEPLAKKLQDFSGAPAQFWLDNDALYRSERKRLKQ